MRSLINVYHGIKLVYKELDDLFSFKNLRMEEVNIESSVKSCREL
jgi:hypothetical protein